MKIKNMNCNNDNIIFYEYQTLRDRTIGDISKIFTKKKADVLIILKKKKPYYVLTSSDIIDALVAHCEHTKIVIYIDKNPKSIIKLSENETVFEAYRIMRSYKIHHLIVVSDEGDYKFVINFYDFASFLTEIALKDELTGLYNRRFFEFILDRYKKEDIEIGVLFVDLDDFKKINDAFGHIFGDEVIKTMAGIIKNSIRDIDYAFRFGGDEFVILLFADLNVVKKVAQRIKKNVAKTSVQSVKFSCSIGYAHYPLDSSSLETVLQIADQRMYEEKKRRKEENIK